MRGTGNSPIDLSIVIPAFNEEDRLPAAFREVRRFLDGQGLSCEIIIVENGSTDRTPQIARDEAADDPCCHVINVVQRGKGRAVRHGMLASRGRIAMYCDADFSMPVEEVPLLLQALEGGADIAIASREAPGSRRVGEPYRRHLMGRVFNRVVRTLVVPGIQDTQCGFKAFKREVAHDLFRLQRVDGWAFDVEVLFLAMRRGYTVREVPITWRYDPSTRVRPVRDTIAMLREVLMIRWNAMRGRYT